MAYLAEKTIIFPVILFMSFIEQSSADTIILIQPEVSQIMVSSRCGKSTTRMIIIGTEVKAVFTMYMIFYRFFFSIVLQIRCTHFQYIVQFYNISR
jgi:hypothetical protein